MESVIHAIGLVSGVCLSWRFWRRAVETFQSKHYVAAFFWALDAFLYVAVPAGFAFLIH